MTTRINKLADMRDLLEQFPEDTLVEFSHGRYFYGVTTSWEGDQSEYASFYGPEFEFEAAQQAWEYVPDEDAVARGMKPASYPYRPATIRFGAECDD